MIDIEKAKEEFLKYVSTYDETNVKIISKREHSLRVMEVCKNIAKSLELSQEEINLAALIGLLHDIARFDQMKIYKTFSDLESFDHGDQGVAILERNNFIRCFIEDDKYDYIIKKSIKNHNKIRIEDGLDEKTLMYSKLIRDADKIDILYESVYTFWPTKKEIEGVEKSLITKECYNEFMRGVPVRNVNNITPLDSIVVTMAFIYDMWFDYSYKTIYENDYINRTIERFEFKVDESKVKMEEIKNKYNNDLKEKVGF